MTVTVTAADKTSRRVKLSTVCKIRNKTVINGEAEINIP